MRKMYKTWYVRDKSEQYPYCILYYGRSHEDCERFIDKLMNSDTGYLWDRDNLEIIYEEW